MSRDYTPKHAKAGVAGPVTLRCKACAARFEATHPAPTATCPACGTKSLPCDPTKDVQIKINTHELRILTIWADNWAQQSVDAQGKKTLHCILERLAKQLPSTPLTMGMEVAGLQDAGYDAQLVTTSGEVKVPPRGKPS